MSRTPETDAMEYCDAMCDPDRVVEADFARKLERERDEWKSKYIQQNKDLGCEMMDPNGTIWDYAKKVQKDLLAMTEQRDRLAEALKQCREDSVDLLVERDWWRNEPRGNYQQRYQATRDNIDRADEALQSLTTKPKP